VAAGFGKDGKGGQCEHSAGKRGFTFAHILSSLQGELQKSREMGAELDNLTWPMNGIHGALGGSLVSAVYSIDNLMLMILLL